MRHFSTLLFEFVILLLFPCISLAQPRLTTFEALDLLVNKESYFQLGSFIPSLGQSCSCFFNVATQDGFSLDPNDCKIVYSSFTSEYDKDNKTYRVVDRIDIAVKVDSLIYAELRDLLSIAVLTSRNDGFHDCIIDDDELYYFISSYRIAECGYTTLNTNNADLVSICMGICESIKVKDNLCKFVPSIKTLIEKYKAGYDFYLWQDVNSSIIGVNTFGSRVFVSLEYSDFDHKVSKQIIDTWSNELIEIASYILMNTHDLAGCRIVFDENSELVRSNNNYYDIRIAYNGKSLLQSVQHILKDFIDCTP